jgi:hypothetical protein
VAKPDPLSKTALRSVADQVGQFLASASATPAAAMAPLRKPQLAESFAICAVGADQVANPPDDLAALVQPSGMWHHQIRSSDGSTHMARSKQAGFGSDEMELQQVFESAIAAKIDRAIAWVDRHVPDDGIIVRLLVIPAYYLHALVLIRKNKYSAVLADQPDGYRQLKYEKEYPLSEFLRRLSKERMAGTLTTLRDE